MIYGIGTNFDLFFFLRETGYTSFLVDGVVITEVRDNVDVQLEGGKGGRGRRKEGVGVSEKPGGGISVNEAFVPVVLA